MTNDYSKNGAIKMETRFTYYPNSQMIKDQATGHTYEGNRKICRLLNDLNDRIDKNIELIHGKDRILTKVLKVNETQQQALTDIGKVCDKYKIKLEDVAETLVEYIELDNGEEL